MTDVENKLAKSEDYISTLEMTVELLQREIEHLRNQIQPKNQEVANLDSFWKYYDISIKKLKQCKKLNELENVFLELLSEPIKAVDIALYTFNSGNKNLERKFISRETVTQSKITYLEEQGFIDWAMDNNEISYVPDFEAALSETGRSNILLLPLKVEDRNIAIFVALVSISKQSISKELDQFLKAICSYAAFIVDNIVSSEEISIMNKKLSSLNKQMFESSKLASVGEIAGSIAREIENPIKVIKGNLQLLSSGVGDKDMRCKIIDHQVDNIAAIINRLKNFSETQNFNSEPELLNLKDLINEVLIFLSFQLQREDISIDKNFDDSEFLLQANRAQLEQAFMNLFLHCKDMMPDGGKLSIGIHDFRNNRVSVTVNDSGEGLSESEIDKIFEPTFVKVIAGKTSSGLYLTKYIIEQLRGSIAVISSHGKGTSFKILLPIFMNKDEN